MDEKGNKRDKREPVARKSLFFVREVREVIIEGQAREGELAKERTCVTFTLGVMGVTFHTAWRI